MLQVSDLRDTCVYQGALEVGKREQAILEVDVEFARQALNDRAKGGR